MAGVNWTVIMNAVPNLKIIKLVRLNTLKAAVSGYRGKLSHEKCGASNIKKRQSVGGSLIVTKDCVISDKVPWNVTEFIKDITYWQVSTGHAYMSILYVAFKYAIN